MDFFLTSTFSLTLHSSPRQTHNEKTLPSLPAFSLNALRGKRTKHTRKEKDKKTLRFHSKKNLRFLQRSLRRSGLLRATSLRRLLRSSSKPQRPIRSSTKEGPVRVTSLPKYHGLKSSKAPQNPPSKCSLRTEPARLSAHEMTLDPWIG